MTRTMTFNSRSKSPQVAISLSQLTIWRSSVVPDAKCHVDDQKGAQLGPWLSQTEPVVASTPEFICSSIHKTVQRARHLQKLFQHNRIWWLGGVP